MSGTTTALAMLGLALVAPAPKATPPAMSSDTLASSLRVLLLDFIPSPLYEDHKQWGMQKDVDKVKWRGKGLEVHPERVKVKKNDGKWKKVVVTTPLLEKTLTLEVRDLKVVGTGKSTFTVYLAFDSHIDYDQQNWKAGTRVWAGSVRGRMRIHLTLNCELQSHLETTKLLPALVLRLRVLKSDIHYDKLVITHVPGIGGDLAKLLGEAVHETVKALKPSLERKLLEKANAAIVKAADTKEIRLGFEKLLGGK